MNAAGSDLDFFVRSGGNELFCLDVLVQRLGILKDAFEPKDMGYEVIGENGQLIEIVESTQSPSVHREREIGCKQLRSLEERNLDAVIVTDISEQHLPGKDPHQVCGGVMRCLDEAGETTVELRDQVIAKIVPSLREQIHEFDHHYIRQILTEQVSAILS